MVDLYLMCNLDHTLQAPLLAYNSFVEVVFSLNRCREGLAASALQSQGPEDAGNAVHISAEDLPPTAGPSPAARAKRDVIYTCAAVALSLLVSCKLAVGTVVSATL